MFQPTPLMCLALLGCATRGPIANQAVPSVSVLEEHGSEAAEPIPQPSPLLLGETFPIETSLDDPAIASAHTTWLDMISNAEQRIDLAQFYVSPHPEGRGRLTPVIAALEAAAERGVQVRVLADAKFAKTYPDTLDRLASAANVELRIYDMQPLTGGVLHAKYFLVDQSVWLGSQNFDWRSLEHIHELGALIRHPPVVEDLAAIFELDWSLAGGAAAPAATDTTALAASDPPSNVIYADESIEIEAVGSPEALLPEGVDWDLPHILKMINTAQTRVRIQLLSYAVQGYDRTEWFDLDAALRAAADRGVSVELMVSDWSKKGHKLRAVQSLAAVEGIEVRFIVIPDWTGGFIDFARTIHSKYMTVDGQHLWLGTSNWSRDYFYASRNVGFVASGPALVSQLDEVFHRIWSSEYAEVVSPTAEYEPRKVK